MADRENVFRLLEQIADKRFFSLQSLKGIYRDPEPGGTPDNPVSLCIEPKNPVYRFTLLETEGFVDYRIDFNEKTAFSEKGAHHAYRFAQKLCSAASPLQRKYLDCFKQRYGVDREYEQWNFDSLTKKRFIKTHDSEIYGNGVDHCSMWGKKGEPPSILVSQPYTLSLSDFANIQQIAERFSLDVEIGIQSWYSPGETFLVVFKRRDCDV